MRRLTHPQQSDAISLTLRQALLTSKTSCNWACPLLLAVDRVLVDNKWRAHALHNASDAALDTEATTMAT